MSLKFVLCHHVIFGFKSGILRRAITMRRLVLKQRGGEF
jgi:hypothetical protein